VTEQLSSGSLNDLYLRARDGDADAESALFERLAVRFRLIAKRYVETDASGDVSQDACAVILKKYRTETFRKSFDAWCQGVIKMTVRSHLQKNRRRARREEPYEEYSAGPSHFQEEAGFRDALRNCLRMVLEASMAYARVLNLTYQGYKTDEICSRLGISTNHYYVSLSRARERMKSCLQEKGYMP